MNKNVPFALSFVLVAVVVLLAGCATVDNNASGDLKKASELNAELGKQYMVQGRMEVALFKLEKALRQNPDNGQAHHYLAEFYRRVDDAKKADEHFRRAMELLPDDAALANNYGAFLCSQKKYDHANRLFQRVLADPVYARKDQVHENMGLCAMQAGNIGLAQKHLEAALRMNHRLSKARLAMAQLRYDRGHFEAAYIEYKRFLEAGQHSAASLWLGALLERQRGNMAAAKAYAVKLKVKFPDSSEAQRLRALEAQGRF